MICPVPLCFGCSFFDSLSLSYLHGFRAEAAQTIETSIYRRASGNLPPFTSSAASRLRLCFSHLWTCLPHPNADLNLVCPPVPVTDPGQGYAISFVNLAGAHVTCVPFTIAHRWLWHVHPHPTGAIAFIAQKLRQVFADRVVDLYQVLDVCQKASECLVGSFSSYLTMPNAHWYVLRQNDLFWDVSAVHKTLQCMSRKMVVGFFGVGVLRGAIGIENHQLPHAKWGSWWFSIPLVRWNNPHTKKQPHYFCLHAATEHGCDTILRHCMQVGKNAFGLTTLRPIISAWKWCSKTNISKWPSRSKVFLRKSRQRLSTKLVSTTATTAAKNHHQFLQLQNFPFDWWQVSSRSWTAASPTCCGLGQWSQRVHRMFPHLPFLIWVFQLIPKF